MPYSGKLCNFVRILERHFMTSAVGKAEIIKGLGCLSKELGFFSIDNTASCVDCMYRMT